MQKKPLNASGTMSPGLAMNSSIILHVYFTEGDKHKGQNGAHYPERAMQMVTKLHPRGIDPPAAHDWLPTWPIVFDKGKVK